MAINVSVQYNGEFLPYIRAILLTVDLILPPPPGNPIKCHEEFLSLHPMFLPKRFDGLSPCLRGAQKV